MCTSSPLCCLPPAHFLSPGNFRRENEVQRSKPLQPMAGNRTRVDKRMAEIWPTVDVGAASDTSLFPACREMSPAFEHNPESGVISLHRAHCYHQAEVSHRKHLWLFFFSDRAGYSAFLHQIQQCVKEFRHRKKKKKMVLWSPTKRVTLPNFLFMFLLFRAIASCELRQL